MQVKSGSKSLIFKFTYNPLWDNMDWTSIWSQFRKEMRVDGFFTRADRILLSRKKGASLGDLANASNKNSLAEFIRIQPAHA